MEGRGAISPQEIKEGFWEELKFRERPEGSGDQIGELCSGEKG